MEIIRETVNIKEMQDTEGLFPAAYFGGLSWATLDIETLGLNASRAPVILAGIVRPDRDDTGSPTPGTARAVQFFAERGAGAGAHDERELLIALEEELEDVDVLVTFNGQTFDIPYLRERFRECGLPFPRRRYDLDIYRVLRDCSDIGRFLPNLRQKTVEDFAGLWEYRKDEISGRESISLYYDYLTKDPADPEREEAKRKILLHNRDDILQLYRLISILKKADMHKAVYRQGLPVREGEHLFLVKVADLKKDSLLIEGIQARGAFDYVLYGDETPTYRLENGRFHITVPLTCYEGLVLADLTKISPAPDVPEDMIRQGYLILQENDEIHYDHINRLTTALLRWISARRDAMLGF